MMQEINPKETSRGAAFEMWMKAPMPMVTLIKTLDVTQIRLISRRSGLKFNMLICWCVGKAASQIKEFYMLPVDARLMRYDSIAVNTIVSNRDGGVSSCDIHYSDSLSKFNTDYLRLTRQVAETGRNHDIAESMVIGTSALAKYDIDAAVGMYSGLFNNPFIIWGRYRRVWFKTLLTVSFQFHHTQMDGAHAARFLTLLQTEISLLRHNINS